MRSMTTQPRALLLSSAGLLKQADTQSRVLTAASSASMLDTVTAAGCIAAHESRLWCLRGLESRITCEGSLQ